MSVNSISAEFSSEQASIAFADFFQKEGLPAFNYTEIDHNIQALYEVPQRSGYLLLREFCRKTQRTSEIDRCVIDYIDERQVQAYAVSNRSFHYIGIAYSLPILLQSIFQYVLSNTNPFSTDDADDIPEYIFPNTMPATQSKQECFDNIKQMLLDTMPEAKWQKVMSTKLAELAVLFCFSHEISHIVWGHSELAQRRGLLGVVEASSNKNSEPVTRNISYSLRQAWELQADRTALGMLYSYVNNNKAYKKRLLNTLRCDKQANPTLQLMARVTYAISFVFFLFGQNQYSVASKTTHPSAITRQTFAIGHLVMQILHLYPESDEEEVIKTIQDAATKAEKAWNRLGFTFGSYGHDMDDLLTIVQRLSRYDALSARFLSHYQWASFIR